MTTYFDFLVKDPKIFLNQQNRDLRHERVKFLRFKILAQALMLTVRNQPFTNYYFAWSGQDEPCYYANTQLFFVNA